MSSGHTTVEILVPLFLNHPSLYPIVSEFFASIPKGFNVLTCDDDSPLPHGFPVTIKNDHNLGFTGTVNRLLAFSKADVMIVANDDLKFKEGDLSWAEKTNGIYFPRDTASGNLDIFGAIWAIDRKTLEKLGYLDESLPHYGSDREYYNRAISKGIPVVKIDDVEILHHESATYRWTGLK